MKVVKFIIYLLSIPFLMFAFGMMILIDTYYKDQEREERMRELEGGLNAN